MRAIRLVAMIAILAVIPVSVASAGKRAPIDPDEVRKRSEKFPADLIHEIAAMQYVLTPDQLSELLSDPDPKSCRSWIDAWWEARDPIPTNAKNEAREEHERRVLTAQAEFGRGKWPGWDDRGEVYIRYGDPFGRQLSGADVIPPGTYVAAGELWYYPQFDIYTQFAETPPYGYVQYQDTVDLPPSERPRNDRRVIASEYQPDLDMDYMAFDFDITGAMHLSTPLASADHDRYMRKVYSYYDLVDQAPSVYAFDFDTMRIPAYVAVQSFRGGDGVDRVDVNTEFMSRVSPLEVDSDYRRFVTTSVFWDRKGDEIARNARVDSIRTALVAGDSSTIVLNMLTMTMPPGAYKMALTVQEEGSGRFAAARRDFFCHDMEGGMAMSDLSLARRIGVARDGSPFNRGALEVVPRPSGRYRVGETVPVYFEVYHVDIDELGKRGYTVEYAVRPKERPRSLWGRVTRRREELLQVRSSFEAVASGPNDFVHVSAATRNLYPGEYVLEVAVTDRATMRRVVRETTFRLVK